MKIEDFLTASRVMLDVRSSDKARLIRELARAAAGSLCLDADDVADTLLKREQLGSTGTGGGIAIPHVRLPGIDRPFGMLARLAKGIDFEAIDGKPVDLVFLLLLPASPQGEQLNTLAAVARKLRDPATLRKLRNARDQAALYRAMAVD
jgi:PTS system nitrogen regulatory IIA component